MEKLRRGGRRIEVGGRLVTSVEMSLLTMVVADWESSPEIGGGDDICEAVEQDGTDGEGVR